MECKCWRNHSKDFAKGDRPPQTIETLQAAWGRDQELIFEQRDEISKLKQKINKLAQFKESTNERAANSNTG